MEAKGKVKAQTKKSRAVGWLGGSEQDWCITAGWDSASTSTLLLSLISHVFNRNELPRMSPQRDSTVSAQKAKPHAYTTENADLSPHHLYWECNGKCSGRYFMPHRFKQICLRLYLAAGEFNL